MTRTHKVEYQTRYGACPFCGETSLTIQEEAHENGETDLPFYAECPYCHARGPAMPQPGVARAYWMRIAKWSPVQKMSDAARRVYLEEVLQNISDDF